MADLELLKKLFLKPGESIALLDAPAGYDERFRGTELSVVTSPGGERAAPDAAPASVADVAILFAPDRAAFERRFDTLVAAVRGGGRVWVSYPKRQKKDLDRNGVLQVATGRGWRPVTQIAIDEDWSAMRLRPLADVGR